MSLQRMRQLAGIGLKEDMNVGGTESDMQTADTDNRNSAYAAYDSSQNHIDVRETDSEEDTAENYAKHLSDLDAKTNALKRSGHHAEADRIYNKEYFSLARRFPNGQREYAEKQNDRYWAGNTQQMNTMGAKSSVDEKSSSEKQARFMAAAAHDPAFAKKVGISQDVAKEFNKADTGTELLSKAMRETMEFNSVEDAVSAYRSGQIDYNQFMDYISRGPDTPPEEPDMYDTGEYTDMRMRQGEMGMREAKKRGTDIDPTQINSIVTMPIEAAKARAAEMISASTTNDTKKSYLMNQVNRARTAIDLAGILYNMVLKGEGHGVQGSHYSRKFDRGMEEGWEAPRPGALRAREVEAIKKLVFNQGVRDGEIAAETGNAVNGFKANDALDIWYQYADSMGFEPDGGETTDSIEKAYEEGFGQGFRSLSEDLNNGYNTEKYATGSDFFPNGADSPVVTATGPSGARQGDNPEQKKMQVAEVHRELVYGYRKFISESSKTK